jgi:hypothetical protein
MWIPSRETLAKSPESTVFVLCRWVEFFDRQTPDTYRPRLCHLPRLVEEIGAVAQQATSQASLRKYLAQLKQECSLKLQQDEAAFKICTSQDLAALKILCSEHTIAADVAHQATCMAAAGFSARYESDALTRGRKAIVNAFNAKPPARPAKYNVSRWLDLWATIALNRNYSVRLDFPARDEAPLSLSLEALLAKITQGITRPLVRYNCYLAIQADDMPTDIAPAVGATPESVNRLKTVLNSSRVKLSSHHDVKGPDFTPGAHDLIVTRELDATSPQAALNTFVLELQPIFNILGFYQNHPPAEPIKHGWAGVTPKALKHYNIDPLSSKSLHPRKEAVQLASDAVIVYKSGRLTGSIANALELYHMAISSPDWRVKFTTMWSALESLASTSEGKSVISRVTNMLVPIVTWRRMDKEIRYLGMTLRQYREVQKPHGSSPNALPNATTREVPSEDVLLTVTRPANHPHIVELLGAVSSHPLLLWRVTSVWRNFHDPAALAADFRSSKERLTWHIARIYRARNQLAHHGKEPPQANLLLDNLHFYLSTAIARFLHALKSNPKFGMKESVEYWQKHSERVYDGLLNTPHELTVGDILSKYRLRTQACPWAPVRDVP